MPEPIDTTDIILVSPTHDAPHLELHLQTTSDVDAPEVHEKWAPKQGLKVSVARQVVSEQFGLRLVLTVIEGGADTWGGSSTSRPLPAGTDPKLPETPQQWRWKYGDDGTLVVLEAEGEVGKIALDGAVGPLPKTNEFAVVFSTPAGGPVFEGQMVFKTGTAVLL